MKTISNLLKDIKVQYGEKKAKFTAGIAIVIKKKVMTANYFAWPYYISEVIEDTIAYIIETDFRLNGGIYVNSGIQRAIDKCRYCNAQKRKDYYSCIPLEGLENIAELADNNSAERMQIEELCYDIELAFGKVLADTIKEFLQGGRGAKLDKKALDILRGKKFQEWYIAYIKI